MEEPLMRRGSAASQFAATALRMLLKGRKRLSPLGWVLAALCIALVAIFEGREESSTIGMPEDALRHVQVVDGDSLRADPFLQFRLQGIDAPERRQKCDDEEGRPYRCGEQAANTLRSLVGADPVWCEVVDHDKYNRLVAVCRTESILLNQEMVRRGWAVAYTRYTDRYAVDEAKARAAKLGIWRGHFEAPEHWRRTHPR